LWLCICKCGKKKCKSCQLELPENEEEYDTLGGLILNFHQDFPEVNQEFIMDRYRFTILAVNERQIKLVQLQNIEELTNS
jgi:CBS domain containing-hemolysin-like protein